MSIDPKFFELTADVLEIFLIKYVVYIDSSYSLYYACLFINKTILPLPL